MEINKSSGKVVFFLLLILLSGCFYFLNNKKIINFTEGDKIASRNEICQLAKTIKSGDRYEDVEKSFRSLNFEFIRKSNKIQGYLVYVAPIELPSFTSQWELVVRGEDEIVREIVIRDVDGMVRSCPDIPFGVH